MVPAINWLNSYSLYRDRLSDWFAQNVSPDWMDKTGELLRILQKENELQEIVKLVGVDALGSDDRVTLETAQSVREDFLQQNAFEDGDSYTQMEKMYGLIELIFAFDAKMRKAVDAGADINTLAALPVRERVGRAKSVDFENYKEEYAAILKEMDEQIAALAGKN